MNILIFSLTIFLQMATASTGLAREAEKVNPQDANLTTSLSQAKTVGEGLKAIQTHLGSKFAKEIQNYLDSKKVVLDSKAPLQMTFEPGGAKAMLWTGEVGSVPRQPNDSIMIEIIDAEKNSVAINSHTFSIERDRSIKQFLEKVHTALHKRSAPATSFLLSVWPEAHANPIFTWLINATVAQGAVIFGGVGALGLLREKLVSRQTSKLLSEFDFSQRSDAKLLDYQCDNQGLKSAMYWDSATKKLILIDGQLSEDGSLRFRESHVEGTTLNEASRWSLSTAKESANLRAEYFGNINRAKGVKKVLPSLGLVLEDVRTCTGQKENLRCFPNRAPATELIDAQPTLGRLDLCCRRMSCHRKLSALVQKRQETMPSSLPEDSSATGD